LVEGNPRVPGKVKLNDLAASGCPDQSEQLLLPFRPHLDRTRKSRGSIRFFAFQPHIGS
jgi:hypothetical protein